MQGSIPTRYPRIYREIRRLKLRPFPVHDALCRICDSHGIERPTHQLRDIEWQRIEDSLGRTATYCDVERRSDWRRKAKRIALLNVGPTILLVVALAFIAALLSVL